MNRCSIVVLSGFPDIFAQFYRSYEMYESQTPLILVASLQMTERRYYKTALEKGMQVIQAALPWSFPKAANAGIAMAGTDDIFLVNDDVQFLQPESIATLQQIVKQEDDAGFELGVLSPQFHGLAGGPLQQRGHGSAGRVQRVRARLAFAGVYLPRPALDNIQIDGHRWLDERFDGYGCDDDDACRRIREAGYGLAVTGDVVMAHGFGGTKHSASFQRVGRYPKSGIDPAMVKAYEDKWGVKP